MMRCPRCRGDDRVLETRELLTDSNYRRRECLETECRRRWSTYEINPDNYPWLDFTGGRIRLAKHKGV